MNAGDFGWLVGVASFIVLDMLAFGAVPFWFRARFRDWVYAPGGGFVLLVLFHRQEK